MRKIILAAATLSTVLPALALAWTPYAPGSAAPLPYPGYAAPYGPPPVYPMAPGYPGAWAASPYAPRGAEAIPATPEAATAAPPPPAAERMPARARPAWPRLNVSRQAGEDAYLIDIQLQNIDPEQVEIQPMGRGLLIRHNAETRVSQQDTLPGGEGYRSHYSFSQGSASRRLGLPPDADLAGMSREVKEGHILIRVPRNAQARGGRW
ncbi:Hsp20/alpha crystallin family protein [Thiocystis violacea]|uniref:Hsp20/alpha crystallin family protein n=1 Tax=Thiocystis violacea TaxID=13725 RepID=UPI0019069877|nr:Hsp20 family protein [Thiocystis violacea]MBK1716595.1 hypothetical protein [Thiocystis violacea]